MKLVNESVSDFLKGKPQHEINATLTQMLPKLLSDLEIEDIEDFEFDIDVPVRTTWLVYQMAPHKRQEILDGIARSAKNYFDGGEVEVEIDRSDIFITIKDALLEGGRGKLEFTLNGMGGPISGDFDGDGGYSQDHDFEDEDYTWKECWDQAQEWQNSNPYWHPPVDEDGRHFCSSCEEYHDEDDMGYGGQICRWCQNDDDEDEETCPYCDEPIDDCECEEEDDDE